ncbi:hypothetical protein KUH03_37095 [Sphingobacterium sp. E70]|uniref:hypothetical protein n=1 Tax=Sphingobacterium sp. E70 TaxID=2853439 RepID=UPI00211CD790|nr:hypothetical protein [Sphingobacterium sp. E70]ULT24519.1 hypothetical protein KUH03_37095 [Sphingobacterium sp. E70]
MERPDSSNQFSRISVLEEGKSVQPVDGVDTQIIIISDVDTISKMNAYNNKIWKSIVEHVYDDRK